MSDEYAEEYTGLEGTKRRYVTWRVPREKYLRLFEKKRHGLSIAFSEYRVGGENVYSSTRMIEPEEIKSLYGAGHYITEHLFDGRVGELTFAAFPPAQHVAETSAASPYSDERPRYSTIRNRSRSRIRERERNEARREREQREQYNTATLLQASIERERAAMERERERERQAIERERERERQHAQQMMELRVEQARLEAKAQAPAQQPDARTLIANDIIERTGIVDEVIDKVVDARSKLENDGEPEPWYGRLMSAGFEAVKPHIGTLIDTAAEVVVARVLPQPQRPSAAQQPSATQRPATFIPIPEQPQPAPAQAPAEQTGPHAIAPPRTYTEACAIVLSNMVGDMDLRVSVWKSAREIMALVEEYPQESADLLSMLKQPTGLLLAAMAAQAPEYSEILKREGAAAWLDELKADVKRRLDRAAQTVTASATGDEAHAETRAAQG